MSSRATITVTAGPDRGKSLPLGTELARVGRAPENDLVLSDSDLADHLASIVERDGRYAIITTVPGGLEIDGTELPAERWVWLPETAELRVSRRTLLRFEFNGSRAADGAESPGPSAATAPGRASTSASVLMPKPVAPAKRPPGDRPGSSGELARARRASGDKPDKKTRTIARFITDGPGEPLVRLGEDGHLPELALAESHVREGRPEQAKQGNPVVLAAVLCTSLGLTLLMLLMDAGSFGDDAARKAAARSEITEYYGSEKDDLKPYQLHLRRARQARGRGDFDSEQAAYRAVLAELRSEAKDKLYRYTGITGRLDYTPGDENRKSDRRLEELIAILLSE